MISITSLILDNLGLSGRVNGLGFALERDYGVEKGRRRDVRGLRLHLSALFLGHRNVVNLGNRSCRR